MSKAPGWGVILAILALVIAIILIFYLAVHNRRISYCIVFLQNAAQKLRLTAGDSVIQETFARGTPMEMLSVYHDVNVILTMSHHCMLRLQSRMKLVMQTANSLTFDLAPTPGLNVNKDMHMHGATYTFLDADHFKLEGVSWKDGKSAPCGPPVIFTRQ